MLYSLAPAYPNAKYIVIVGGDNVIPQRRLVDLTLVANERKYAAKADNALLTAAFQNRYYLSDDYYAATLPYGIAGREMYVPQYGLGRLIESPDEIVAMIDAYTQQPTISPHKRAGYRLRLPHRRGQRDQCNLGPTGDQWSEFDDSGQ